MSGGSGGVSDDIISMTVDDDILICEMPASGLQALSQENAWEAYVSLLSRHDLKGIMTVFTADAAIDTNTTDIWDRSMQRAAEEGIRQWVIVTDAATERVCEATSSPPDLEVSCCGEREAGIECLREPPEVDS
ncbi:MAG: hypothetical protein SVG88_11510 [Halobacteriales archaeon]|nr:hypothetical protein [Halobacteriales archaeon]